MRNKICLDTDICVNFLRDNNEEKSYIFLKAFDLFVCCVSAITVYELTLGAGMMKDKSSQNLEGFLRNLIILDFNFAIAQRSSEIQISLRKEGKEIGLPDTFIAATCLVYDLPLLTGNKNHYQRVKNLSLLDF